MKRSERCKRGLSDESEPGFLAQMCPDVTTVVSFHHGLDVKGRLFHLSLQLRLLVCVRARERRINVCTRALDDLPCEQWRLYALLIANQWALWDVWHALKSPTRHILVCQHIYEH